MEEPSFFVELFQGINQFVTSMTVLMYDGLEGETKLRMIFPFKNVDAYYEKQKTIVKMGVMQSLSEFFSIHGVFPKVHSGFSIWNNMLRCMLPTTEVFQNKELGTYNVICDPILKTETFWKAVLCIAEYLFMIGFVRMENLIFIQ